MKIRLIRKLADHLDGVDVSHHRTGDMLNLPAREARMLLAEGWAARVSAPPRRAQVSRRRFTPSARIVRVDAGDATQRRAIERLREFRNEMEQRQLDPQDSRRAEDRIREELRDSRAKTLPH